MRLSWNTERAAGLAATALCVAGLCASQAGAQAGPQDRHGTQAAARHPQCIVRVTFTVDAHGGESIRVAGQCAGRPPTAGEVARLAKPLVVPAWLHFAVRHRHWWVICGGPCGTSAKITDRGQAFTS